MGSLCLYRQQRGLLIFFRSAGLQLTLALLFCSIALSRDLYAQEPLERKVTISLKSVTLEKALTELERAALVKFVYSRSRVKVNVLVTVDATDKKLSDLLKELLEPRGIDFSASTVKEQILLYLHADGPPKTGELNQPVPDNQQQPSQGFRADITGTVLDAATQQPLPGVNVVVRGTTNGTSTNADGKYSLTASDNDILVFSFIGYKPFETNIAGRTLIDVGLESDVTALKEVVINAGYYDVKDKEKTSSISKVTSDAIEKQPVTNPLAAIQGRMPGVYIQQASGTPGGEFRIQIRGLNSLRPDGNQPLYIVDGVPFSTEKTFSSLTAAGSIFGTTGNDNNVSQVSPLSSLNMADIESIEILKDADGTSLYGSRGANGVVLITTKKGKPGKTTFDLNVYSGVGQMSRVRLLNTEQFLALRREAFANDGITPSANPADGGYSAELMQWDTTRYTDWQKKFLGTAQLYSAQASVSGGSEHTQFLFSLGYRKENSVYPGNLGYQKGSFHLSVNHASPDKKFTINTSMSGAKDKNNQLAQGLGYMALRLAPNAPALFDESGELNWENSTWENPLAATKVSYENSVINFNGKTLIGYEFLPGLQFKTSFGLSYLQSDEQTKRPSTSYNPAFNYTSANSQVGDATGVNQSWIIEPQLNWERQIAKGKLTVLFGSTFQEQQLDRRLDFYQGFPSNALMGNLSLASIKGNREFVQSLYRYMAVFGRVNYNWKGKYIVNLTGRRDGSSRFGPRRQFANFGAFGIAWIFSEEDFVRNNVSFLSFGKFRLSYGGTGNDQIGNYQYLDTYASSASSGGNQYQGVTYLSPTKLFNADYAWEVNEKFEAASELGFFKDRISITINYFRNRSSSQLVDYALPQTTGFSGILANLPATVQNTGIELEITTSNIRSQAVEWITSFNITVPRNKLVAFPDLESSSYSTQYIVGQPLSISRYYQYTGINSETGLYTFRDINGDGTISSPQDRTTIAFTGQRFFWGLNNSITYRGLSLDFLFQFVKQKSDDYANYPRLGSQYNTFAFLYNKTIWRKPGDKADVQKLYSSLGANPVANVAQQNYINSDAVIADASFIRLKNVSLSWVLPAQWIKKIKCRIYFQGQNLLLFTRYQGSDPENQNATTLSPLRMYTIGTQLTL